MQDESNFAAKETKKPEIPADKKLGEKKLLKDILYNMSLTSGKKDRHYSFVR